jgi:cobalamin synthase
MGWAVQVLRFINLLSAALITGSQVLVFAVVLPVMRRWSPEMALQTHRAMLAGAPDKYIVPSAVAAPLSAILIILLRHRADVSSLFDVIGILAAAGVTLASVAFAEPLSRRIVGNAGDSAGTYVAIQQRWDNVHAARTAAALLMAAAFIVAALTE